MASTATETSTQKSEPVPDSSVSMPNSSSKNKEEEDAQADACSCSTRAQNLSFVLEGVNKVKFEDRPIPEIKNPHDVLVQVKYTGICGSDVSYAYVSILSFSGSMASH